MQTQKDVAIKDGVHSFDPSVHSHEFPVRDCVPF